jgi:cell wall-associated NlpC family hydrolase
MLVGAKAHYPSARAAAEDLHLSVTLPVPLGGVVFFGSEPWGHCGLYVGDGLVLTVSREGLPVLLDEVDDEREWGGPYLGWCPAKALREAGEHG